jgi:predicted alpha/beta superfamily hydrolase
MLTQATIWLTIGGILLFVILEDPKVFHWLVLVSKIASLWVEQKWFLIKNHPDTPWVRYQIKRNADRTAKQLMDELNGNK